MTGYAQRNKSRGTKKTKEITPNDEIALSDEQGTEESLKILTRRKGNIYIKILNLKILNSH